MLSNRVRLADVAISQLGKMLDKAKNRGTLRPYLRNPDVRWFDINTTNLQAMPFEDHEIDRFSLKPGDVVVCEGGEAGRAGIWTDEHSTVMIQKALHRVRCGPRLINRFLVHRLMYDYFHGALSEYYTGTTIKHFTGKDLARYEFPLPPLEEQRRIVAILDQADDLRRKRRLTLEKLNTLPQAIFQEMFGSARVRSERYPVQSLGELICVSSGGALTQAQIIAGPFPVYGGNGINGYHSDSMVSAGTIIIGRVGAYCGAVHVTTSKAWVTDNALIVSIKSGAVQRTYLSAALTNAKLNQYAGRSAQPLISGGRIYPIKIPVPPLAEQERFALAAAAARSTSEVSDEQALLIEKLFAALQFQAFNGEL